MQELALDGLHAAGLRDLVIDLADARIVRGVLAGVPVDGETVAQVVAALATKNRPALAALAQGFPAESRQGLLALPGLYGGLEVLDTAGRPRRDIKLVTRPGYWMAAVPE